MAYVINAELYKELIRSFENKLRIKIEPKSKKYGEKTFYISAYKYINGDIYVPFYYGINSLKTKLIRTHTSEYTFTSKLSLRYEQKECRSEALDLLKKNKSVIISCYTGFGKTITCINICTKIQMKVFISVPKKQLLTQWEVEIKKFAVNVTVEILTCEKIKNNTWSTVPDFCIIYGLNIEKIPTSYLQHFGILVIDEAHLQMTNQFMSNLLNLTPKYLIGLTATPYRKDGFQTLFQLFFGNSIVKKPLYKKHVVFKVNTNIRFREEYNLKTNINWNSILTQQANNVERNRLIVNIVSKFHDRSFLILVKRIEHAKFLYSLLTDNNEYVTILVGNSKNFDKNARILIGTTSKIGTGFDHPKLDTLLVAADAVSYYIQFLGRIMRRQEVEPIVFDLVDSNSILRSHYLERKKIYIDHGGEIKDYTIC